MHNKFPKIVLVCFSFLIAGIASAASVTWGAGGFATGDYADGVTGVAYLIQAPENVDQTAIASYLSTYGTNYSGTDYSLIGQNDLDASKGFSNVDLVRDSVASGTYFTLILCNDGTFILSDLREFEIMQDPSGDSLNVNFPVMGSNPAKWVNGTVPEPTALVLLVLGVAGVALRRRA